MFAPSTAFVVPAAGAAAPGGVTIDAGDESVAVIGTSVALLAVGGE